MKKKLTKEQKEKRQHFLKVTKNVVFYISLALNVLVLIAFAITGCSPKSNVQSIDRVDLGEATQLRKEKQYQYNDNQAVVSYDLTVASSNAFSNTNVYYGNEGFVSKGLESTYNIINSNLTLDNVHVLTFRYSLHPDATKMWFEICGWDNANQDTLLIVSSFTYQNGVVSKSPYSQVYNDNPVYTSTYGFWFTFNETITSNASFDWENLLPFFFDKSGYTDYNLYYNWSPYSYFTLNNYVVDEYRDHTSILSITSFAINGLPYDSLTCYWGYNKSTGSNGIYERKPLRVFNGNNLLWQQDLSISSISDECFIRYIDAINSNTNVHYRIWSTPEPQLEWVNGSEYLNIYVNGSFTSGSAAIIRLFDINSHFASGVSGYINGNVLGTTINGSGSTITGGTTSSNTGSLSNVFTLFTMSFQGLGGLFAIQLLPGITLGALLFVPLVAVIVFALVRLLRK